VHGDQRQAAKDRHLRNERAAINGQHIQGALPESRRVPEAEYVRARWRAIGVTP
jgi:hypothetical protein